MLVSITSTTPDATDLGYLLHKHPDRVRSVNVGFGKAHVFYPESGPERCTATLLVDVDPIALSRRGRRSAAQTLEPYVNDRPYVASSMLSVALGRVYGTAMAGTCEARPELVDRELELEIELPVLPARGGEDVVRRLFEPLGYDVACSAIALDDQFPDWGDSRYLSVTLSGVSPIRRALEHLYVLLPVLDDRKHYWIGEEEIEKLLRRGGDWLAAHPEVEIITRRYLRFGSFAREALAQLSEGMEDTDAADEVQDMAEAVLEKPLSLNEQRLHAVADAVVAAGGGRVVDLGCGEGRFIERLLAEASVSHVLGMDVSIGALERAEKRLRLDEMSERRRERVALIQGALTYTDDRIQGFDVATVIEVIEHVDVERLDVLSRVLFGHAAPSTVIVTTPNVEYNVHFEQLGPSSPRHRDHRFEWTRSQFQEWAAAIGSEYGYRAEFLPIGPSGEVTGPPTQMAIFHRAQKASS
ncbi:MAG: 3' terminal RNA ribose 2'-O-methyltransferase Hen1 [Actinobacteria bacterium]|nr:3' terminal RNA ribose 2'-O-methyltransferase Hen1 [Actinomycetota bacterium]